MKPQHKELVNLSVGFATLIACVLALLLPCCALSVLGWSFGPVQEQEDYDAPATETSGEYLRGTPTPTVRPAALSNLLSSHPAAHGLVPLALYYGPDADPGICLTDPNGRNVEQPLNFIARSDDEDYGQYRK